MSLTRVRVQKNSDATGVGIRLSIKQGDEILWEAVGKSLRVEFREGRTPFTEPIFVVPEGAAVLSGPLKADAYKGSPYEYDVIDPATNEKICPTIFVDP